MFISFAIRGIVTIEVYLLVCDHRNGISQSVVWNHFMEIDPRWFHTLETDPFHCSGNTQIHIVIKVMEILRGPLGICRAVSHPVFKMEQDPFVMYVMAPLASTEHFLDFFLFQIERNSVRNKKTIGFCRKITIQLSAITCGLI